MGKVGRLFEEIRRLEGRVEEWLIVPYLVVEIREGRDVGCIYFNRLLDDELMLDLFV